MKHTLVGTWAVCSIGRLGRIDEVVEQKNGDLLCKGRNIAGLPWQTTRPVFVSDADSNLLNTLFGKEIIE